jgi:chain length determinant protein EpsF
MNFTQLLLVLRGRAWIVIVATGVTVATALVASLLQAKSYTAVTTLVVDSKSKDLVTGVLYPSQLLPSYLATQLDIMKSQTVALKVIQNLKLSDDPDIKESYMEATEGAGSLEHWLADRLLEDLEVEPPRESSVFQISYTADDPDAAADISNAFAQAYIDTNLELKVVPARQTSEWFEAKIIRLRNSLEEAQSKLSTYQIQQGLVASDERQDIETAQLAELSTQLLAARSATYDSISRKKASEESLPEVINSPVVQQLRTELNTAEARLSELSQSLGKNHPEYKSAKAVVDSLRAKLDLEIRTATKGVSTTAKVAMQTEDELRSSLDALKDKVLNTKTQRDQLNVLLRDVDNAQQAYDEALQRYHQTSLEAESTQTDVVILNRAVAPAKPSSPRILLNLILATFLGGLLGIGLALFVESLDRRVRSAEDMAGTLEIPLLAELC